MNKTLYVPDNDWEVFEDAQLLHGKVSQLVIVLLRKWLNETDRNGQLRKQARELQRKTGRA